MEAEAEDLLKLSASSGSEKNENGVHSSGGVPVGGDSLPGISDCREEGEYAREDGENDRITDTVNIENEDNQCLPAPEFDKDVDSPPTSQVCAELTETVVITENVSCLNSEMHAENEDGEYTRDGENERINETSNIENEDNQCLPDPEFDEDMDISPPTSKVRAELTETLIEEKVSCLISEMHAKNVFVNAEQRIRRSYHKEDIPFASSQEIKTTALSGAKRPRTTVAKQQGSVHVIYKTLTRESRQKLEELLQQWSQWDARHCSSSIESNEALESGEETYFPALHIGTNKDLAVSFWMDNQTKNPPNKEFVPLDGNSVPLYDRGFSMALTSTDGSSNMDRGFEVLDTSRCFNCGSYSHSLKDCPKPRNNVAVNSARKQLKSKRNQNPGSRNSTRYYQSSPKGKFDGLTPGVLDAETRRLLGLGELDPPPWLNRMREIGYPPGYLDPEEEDRPSGITIFADEESKEETEEGEIFGIGSPEAAYPVPPSKKTVEFPGINAPIPENADKRRWEAGSSSSNVPRNHSHRSRYDRSSESISRWHYPERSRDYQDDGPPGCEPRTSPPSWSSYSHRYGSYDSGYTNHTHSGNSSGRSPTSARSFTERSRSPTSARSFTERSRRSTHDDSNRGVYGSLP